MGTCASSSEANLGRVLDQIMSSVSPMSAGGARFLRSRERLCLASMKVLEGAGAAQTGLIGSRRSERYRRAEELVLG
jgi:hypothetical protein